MGLVAVPAALLGSRMTAVFSPRRKGRLPSGLTSVRMTVVASGVLIELMLSKIVFLALLVEPSALARSKLNLTSLLSKASPSWNLIPLRSLKV